MLNSGCVQQPAPKILGNVAPWSRSQQGAAAPLCVSDCLPVSDCILCSDEDHGLFPIQSYS